MYMTYYMIQVFQKVVATIHIDMLLHNLNPQPKQHIKNSLQHCTDSLQDTICITCSENKPHCLPQFLLFAPTSGRFAQDWPYIHKKGMFK